MRGRHGKQSKHLISAAAATNRNRMKPTIRNNDAAIIGTQLREAGGSQLKAINASSSQDRTAPTVPGRFCSRRDPFHGPELPQALRNGLAEPGTQRRTETASGLDKTNNAVEAFTLPEIGHDEWPLAPHPPRIDIHFLQRCADMRREVDLVDD